MSKQTELKSLLETVFVVIGTFVGAILIITFATSKSDSGDVEPAKVVEKEPVEENVQPVAKVAVADSKTAQSNSLISGEKISQANCIMCHGSGLMNAPKIGDAGQWEPRIAQGKDKLIAHAINGIKMMPAKGGNASLSDEEVAAAVIWMANQSGGNL